MTLEQRLRAALDAKAKPSGALGRLEDLAVQLGVLQGTMRPRVEAAIVVFAGDHGAVAAGVSAYPQVVTAAMVGAYLEGRAAINMLAAGTRLLVVDAGVATALPAHPALLNRSIARGTSSWVDAPAMSAAEAARAVAAGGGVVDGLAGEGCTVVALGEMGIGNTASAALVAAKVLGTAPQVGRGAGHDDAGLARKRAAVAQGAARTALQLAPMAALAEYGGFEVAMLAGAILRGAERGVCMVIDGVIVTAAAVVAHAMEPGCLDACVFAHRSAEPGHDAMLRHLGAVPLLDFGLRLGEGSGAALALPLLRAAAALFDMAELAEVAPPVPA